MNGQISTVHFYFHFLYFKIRDFFVPPITIVKEAPIEPGCQVVDYGCGPGSYTVVVSRLCGPTGKVYAVDINPSSIRMVSRIIAKKKLKNIETICHDSDTGLADNSIDTVLLYDVYHALDNPGSVMREIYRILKPRGVLSFRDHRMDDEEIGDAVVKENQFQLIKRYKETYSFRKIQA